MKKRVLCFGDSNTWGANPLGGRHDENTRWTCLLQEILGFDGYYVIEDGINGRTTVWDDPYFEERNGLKALPYALLQARPLDLVIIMLGTNDMKTEFDNCANAIALGINKLVGTVKETLAPKAEGIPEILIISPITVSDNIEETGFAAKFGLQAIDKQKQLAPLYENVARAQGIHFADGSAMGLPSKEDGIHMLADQHARFAREASKTVKSIIG